MAKGKKGKTASKGKTGKAPSAAQIAARAAFAERNRGRRGRAGAGKGAVTLARKEDTSTPTAPSAFLVRGASLRIDKEVVATTSKRDSLAIAMGFLLAMRNAAIGMLGRRDDMQRLALTWVNAPGAESIGAHLKGVNLDAEINFGEDVLGAVPAAAEALGFAGAEWAACWDAVTREVRLDPIGPIGEVTGSGAVVPAKGTITSRFSIEHPALDVAVPTGSPMRSPEDAVVQSVDRNVGLGLNVVLASRKPNGDWPVPFGTSGIVMVHEGMRYHTFGHLSSVPTDLKRGDKLDAGRVFAYSGGTKGSDATSTGPHYHWRMAIALAKDGAVKTVPMDPLDFISEDAITGRGPGRAPSPSWSVLDKGKIAEVPSRSVVVHGDLIVGGAGDITSKGGKIDVGDVDVLGLSIGEAGRGDDPFADLNASKIGTAAGGTVLGAIGAVYGGPIGGKIGSMMGQAAGGLVGGGIDKIMKQG